LKTLILTEKPSVARDFAAALSVNTRGNGHFESEQFIITWAIGHLLELKAPEDYDSKWKRWSLDTLPILPDRLSYSPNAKTKKQLTVVKAQLQRKDLATIIVATDAGREGELIARTLLDFAQIAKHPKILLLRFWTSQALSKKVILDNIKNAASLAQYDRLYFAGRARQSADWLVGMNLSRLATIKMGDLFSVGRVQTAVLALLAERRLAIDNFKPVPYFQIIGKFLFATGELLATWFDSNKKEDASKIENKTKADLILKNCAGQEGVVTSIVRDKKMQVPPQLFSLTELQKLANRLYGFSAQETLSIAQNLYEKKKCLSYPRTDAQVLGTSSLEQVQEMLTKLEAEYGDYFKYFDEKKLSLKNHLVFDDNKLTDHHALMPLAIYHGNLSSDEGKIYDLVVKRFVAVFSANFEYEQTTIVCKIGQETFKASGQRIICLGWKMLAGGDSEKFLPPLIEGERSKAVELRAEQKETRPPNEYSEASLLHDMANPSKLVQEAELKKIFRGEVGLGTQATRAQIIETLLSRKYVTRSEKNLQALPKGMALVETLKKMPISKVLASPEETAKWELDLSHIAQGSGDPKAFMLAIRKFVADCATEWKQAAIVAQASSASPVGKKAKKYPSKVIGECPFCKSSVLEFPKSFGCKNWKAGCKFTVWKIIAGKKITAAQASKIIKNGRSDLLRGFKSKGGNVFSAYLVINKNAVVFEFIKDK